MSIILPQYLKAKNATAIGLTGLNVAVDGTLSDAFTADLHTQIVFDSFEFEAESGTEDFSPADVGTKIYALTQEDWTVTLGEIEWQDGYSNVMATWGATDYFRVSVSVRAPGAASDGGLFVATCVRSSIRKGLVTGKNAAIITGKPCGVPCYYGLASGYSPTDGTNPFNQAAAGNRPIVAHSTAFHS